MPHLFTPLTDPGRDAAQPHLRLADVSVLEHRRVRHRLAPRPPRQLRRRRRRRWSSPRPPPSRPTAGSARRTSASGRTRTSTGWRGSRASSTPGQRRRHPARARRPQGQHATSLGWSWRRHARRGRLARRRRAERDAVLGHLSPAAGAHRSRASAPWWTPSRTPPAARGRQASGSSRSTPRTATCCTSSCRRSATPARTQYGGTFENRCRLTLEVVRAIRARWPERRAAVRARVGHRLGRRRLGHRRVRRSRAPAGRGRRRPDRLFVGRQRVAPAHPGRARLSGAVRRAHPPRGRHPDRRGRPHHRRAPGRRHHHERRRPTSCCSHARCCATRAGPCTRRRHSATRRRGPRSTCAPRPGKVPARQAWADARRGREESGRRNESSLLGPPSSGALTSTCVYANTVSAILPSRTRPTMMSSASADLRVKVTRVGFSPVPSNTAVCALDLHQPVVDRLALRLAPRQTGPRREVLDAQHQPVAFLLDDQQLVQLRLGALHVAIRRHHRRADGRHPVLLDVAVAQHALSTGRR